MFRVAYDHCKEGIAIVLGQVEINAHACNVGLVPKVSHHESRPLHFPRSFTHIAEIPTVDKGPDVLKAPVSSVVYNKCVKSTSLTGMTYKQGKHQDESKVKLANNTFDLLVLAFELCRQKLLLMLTVNDEVMNRDLVLDMECLWIAHVVGRGVCLDGLRRG